MKRRSFAHMSFLGENDSGLGRIESWCDRGIRGVVVGKWVQGFIVSGTSYRPSRTKARAFLWHPGIRPLAIHDNYTVDHVVGKRFGRADVPLIGFVMVTKACATNCLDESFNEFPVADGQGSRLISYLNAI